MEPSSRSTILVVEDNPAMNAALCDILEIKGYQVISASNGVEALNLLRQERPDVILCDIMMPVMDGYGLLRQARADELLRTVPFIFLSARASSEDRRRARSLGVDDYLIKPVDPDDLVIAVENVLRRIRHMDAEFKRQMDELRTQIVSTLQHEFRTPLTFILGYAEYLAEVMEDEEELAMLRSSVEAILEGGHRLQSMIEKFLLLADIQQRQDLPDRVQLIRLNELVQTIVTSYTERAKEAGLTLLPTLSREDAVVLGDIQYLQGALKHLLDNALLYRRPDSARVWVAVETDETQDYVGLRVQDEGPGIPEEHLDRLRQPFEQVDRTSRTTPGAGLSLAVVHHIARLHGGYLQIESNVGEGSAFTLWLPRPLDSALAKISSKEQEATP